MRKNTYIHYLLFVLLFWAFTGCATQKEETDINEQNNVEQPKEVEVEPSPLPESPPEEVEPQEIVSEGTRKEETLVDIQALVEKMNKIIASGDFDEWKNYLSDEYIREKSDPEYLRQSSESPILRKNNIQLKSLKDFFIYIVKPSRANARVDDIEFIDDVNIIAKTQIGTQIATLYKMIYIDGKWKIHG